jgi:hypothetical protein
MSQLEPGDPNAPLDRWWDEQRRQWGKYAPSRERVVRDLLDLLACALGPLKRSDLLGLLVGSRNAGWGLEELLAGVRPFVSGDGEAQGYVLSDPSLKGTLHARLSDSERVALEDRFLAWCQAIHAELKVGGLAPEAAPAYAIRNYGAHLERRGGRDAELLSLVSDPWRRAWIALEGSYAGFLLDVERAWHVAVEGDRREAEQGNAMPQLGMEVRCALCRSSVVSLASHLPTVLLGALVEKGVWTPAQGLAWAMNVPAWQRSFATLAPHLPEDLLWQVVEATLETEDCRVQARHLVELAPHLTTPMLRRVSGAVAGKLEEWAVSGELANLVPYLPPESLREIMNTIRVLPVCDARVHVLVALVPHLPEDQLPAALSITRALESTGARAFVSAKMIPRLPQAERADLVSEALAMRTTSDDERYRVHGLIEILRYLPKTEQVQKLPALLADISALKEEVLRMIALEDLACYVTEPLAEEALAVVRGIRTGWMRAHALVSLAPSMPTLLLGDMEAIARTIEERSERANALAALAPRMSEAMLEKTLNEALEIDKQWFTADALAKLIPALPEKLAREVLTRAWEIENDDVRARVLAALAGRFVEIGCVNEAAKLMMEIQSTWAWVEILPKVVTALSAAQMRETLTAARAIDAIWMRAEALAALAPLLPDDERSKLMEDVLATLAAEPSMPERDLILPKLVTHLPKELLGKAAGVAQRLDDQDQRTHALISLAVYLAKLGESQEALRIVNAIDSAEGQAVGLVELVMHLPEPGRTDVRTRAKGAAQGLPSASTQTRLLAELAKSSPLPERSTILSEALEAASQIEIDSDRDRAVASITPLLPESLVRKVTSSSWVGEYGGRALPCLAQRLGELGFPGEGLALALGMEDEAMRAKAIAALAPRLPETLMYEARAAVDAIGGEESHAIGLAALASALPAGDSAATVGEALALVRAIASERERASALVELIPLLPEKALAQVLADTSALEGGSWKDIVLERLALRYCELNCPDEAFKVAQGSSGEWARVRTIAALAPEMPQEMLLEALGVANEDLFATTRTEIFSDLSPELAKCPRSELVHVWHGLLPQLASRPRSELLQDLCALMPVISVLGGSMSLTDIALSVGEVAQWWR